MFDEKAPWEQQDGEPNRWFQRFSAFRLLGPGRTVIGANNQEREKKGKPKQVNTPGSWSKAATQWRWYERANAWDSDVIAQADKQWRKDIMGEAELLSRLSQMGRANIDDFIGLAKDGHITSIKLDELKKRGYLVKKISSSEGKTNSISVELYDAQSAMGMIGKHLKLFIDKDENEASVEVRSYALPADVLAPTFLKSYRAVKSGKYTEFLEYGGRGSTKSSFISLMLVELIKNNPTMHALVMRQVANTLRDSVYAQIRWAIGELGLANEFKCTTSPMEITYIPTGQKIYFRGGDDPGNIKSIKTAFGYIGILWFEELDQFYGAESVRKIEQSIRGGDKVYFFKSWNPPRTTASWVSKYIQLPKPTQYQHASNYLDVPAEWLGQPWLDEAEHLKTVNPRAYEHEYMGIANGNGGQVFENVQIRKITDDEIKEFDRVLHGLDWGFYPDPVSYGRMHYDAARLTLYIFGEYRANKRSNRQVYDDLVKMGLQPNDLIIADSAEPKSIGDFRDYGASIRGAEKGPDSVDYSMKWLQSLKAIVIDNERAPYHAEELLNYELEQDKNGEFISAYPDKNNHAIDDVRYATNLIWRRKGQ